jgi:hypothetical protein
MLKIGLGTMAGEEPALTDQMGLVAVPAINGGLGPSLPILPADPAACGSEPDDSTQTLGCQSDQPFKASFELTSAQVNRMGDPMDRNHSLGGQDRFNGPDDSPVR